MIRSIAGLFSGNGAASSEFDRDDSVVLKELSREAVTLGSFSKKISLLTVTESSVLPLSGIGMVLLNCFRDEPENLPVLKRLRRAEIKLSSELSRQFKKVQSESGAGNLNCFLEILDRPSRRDGYDRVMVFSVDSKPIQADWLISPHASHYARFMPAKSQEKFTEKMIGRPKPTKNTKGQSKVKELQQSWVQRASIEDAEDAHGEYFRPPFLEDYNYSEDSLVTYFNRGDS